MRERLHRLGVDPDRLVRPGSGPPAPDDPNEIADELEKLRDLRDRGLLSYERARERLRRY
jgi:hypothetical protein